ncbi:MAG: cation-translocating P-type ATPase [Patescibacteria group bacterium]
MPQRSWYKQTAEQVMSYWQTPDVGLTQTEAESRLVKYGTNELPSAPTDSYLKIFLRQFQSPLIYVLLLASLIMFLLKDWLDAGIITIVLILNSVLGSIQEGRAQNTLAALKKFTTTQATVIRDGEEKIVEDREVVPGDLIVLRDGDKIPADCRLVQVTDLRVDESALTGESQPVSKHTGPLFLKREQEISKSDQLNMVFRGTYVVGGLAQAVVVATGAKTVVGEIGTKLEDLGSDLPLKKNIKGLSHLIILVVALVGLLLFGFGLLYGNSAVDMFTVVVAVAVSSIPEGLPVVITLVLSAGVWRMSKRQALVKKLQAVEALGQASIIAVDKTGTVTRNEMMVGSLMTSDKILTVSGQGYKPEGKILWQDELYDYEQDQSVLELAAIAGFNMSVSVAYNETEDRYMITGDPTEAALAIMARKTDFNRSVELKSYKQIDEIPFSSDKKYKAVLNKDDENNKLRAVGAPEVILDMCQYELTDKGVVELTQARKEELENRIYDWLQQGLRVLAGAYTETESHNLNPEKISGLVWVGSFGLSDVVRTEAIEAVKTAHTAGIKVIMITGDHKVTAEAIAKQVGIWDKEAQVITGQELNQMSDDDLAKIINSVRVFARVTPDHKLKIVKAYKKAGQVIAMTGDGVNDALSLVAADLGVAMGKIGTEVAKEASDIILLDDNFGSIVAAVEEGRNIYVTIKKVILYLFATGLGEIFVITGAVLLNWPLPLIAGQIIWLNLVTDGLLDATLALEPKEKNLLSKIFVKPSKYILDKMMTLRLILMSLVMVTATLFLFSYYIPVDLNQTEVMIKAWTITLTMLAVFHWFNIWNCRSDSRSIFSMRLMENPYLVGVTGIVVLLHLSIIYTSFGQTIMRTTALTLGEWFAILLIGLWIILVEEIRKLIFRLKRTI